MVEAVVIKNNRKIEVRCGICGKLLFTVCENSKKGVDISQANVIIVARCTRSSCKNDNTFSFQTL